MSEKVFEKELRIMKEIESWEKIFDDLSPEKKSGAQRLIEQVAFMKITLEELQMQIIESGPIYHFRNGKQEMLIEHPAQKSYNTMINRYTTAVDKLLGYLPREAAKEVDDGFANFVSERL